jgi:lysine 2,3-aminomutase
MLVRYQAEDKPNTITPTPSRGVSNLLQGTKSSLMPEGNERMARRRKIQLAEHDEAQAACGGGEAGTDGAALRPIIPLPMLASHTNGNGHAAAH